MYTQCPHCLTIFAIDEDVLQTSLGIVHCGHCGQRFDALGTLSNTLPTGGDAAFIQRNPEQRVPTLTATVPAGSFKMRVWHQGGAGEPATPAQVSGPADPPREANVGGAAASAEFDRPPSANSADWFAEFECATASRMADATAVSSYGMCGRNAWQVGDAPAGAGFLGADLAITFEDSWTRDSGGFLGPDWLGAPEYGPIGPTDAGVPGAATPIAPASPGLPSIAQAGMPFEEIGPADLEGFDPRPAQATAPPPSDEPDVGAPAGDERATDDAPTPAEAMDADAAGEREPEPAPSGVASDLAQPSPPVYVRPRRRPIAGIAWTVGCLVLALALAAQLVWNQRKDLVRDPATRAWAARVCGVIDCRLPPIREVAKLELLARDVRPDPRVPGALMITATMRNDASFRQPWPVVVVELTDLDNQPVAMRRFRAAEYMPDPARRAAGIAPGATSAIAFEVVDPGKRAVAFQFRFE